MFFRDRYLSNENRFVTPFDFKQSRLFFRLIGELGLVAFLISACRQREILNLPSCVTFDCKTLFSLKNKVLLGTSSQPSCLRSGEYKTNLVKPIQTFALHVGGRNSFYFALELTTLPYIAATCQAKVLVFYVSRKDQSSALPTDKQYTRSFMQLMPCFLRRKCSVVLCVKATLQAKKQAPCSE